MLKMISYLKNVHTDRQDVGGIGQGGGGYWQEQVGVRLQEEIAKVLGAELTLSGRPYGFDSFDRRDYPILAGEFDIAYCQLFEVPSSRPAKWIYSIISDYLHMEEVLEDFLLRTKPDVLITLQYPIDPPAGKPNLRVQCEHHGCELVFLPWFNAKNMHIHNPYKDIVAMCTGRTGICYPMRHKIYRYLESLNRKDIVLSGNPSGVTFRLSDDEYHDALGCCQYYITGGIYDFQIPPKYYEVCNYGATLVSHELAMMEEAGFVDGETYLKLDKVEDIPDILESTRYDEIGFLGQEMVQSRHSIERRAKDIAELFSGEHYA